MCLDVAIIYCSFFSQHLPRGCYHILLFPLATQTASIIMDEVSQYFKCFLILRLNSKTIVIIPMIDKNTAASSSRDTRVEIYLRVYYQSSIIQVFRKSLVWSPDLPFSHSISLPRSHTSTTICLILTWSSLSHNHTSASICRNLLRLHFTIATHLQTTLSSSQKDTIPRQIMVIQKIHSFNMTSTDCSSGRSKAEST